MNPKLNAIGIVVSDMDSAVAFYARLGLHFQLDDDSHASCELAGGVKVMLDTEDLVRSLVPEWTRPSGGHAIGLAFEFPTPAEVDAKFSELTGAGHRFLREPWDAFWGQRYAMVLDPDGNAIDLYSQLSRS